MSESDIVERLRWRAENTNTPNATTPMLCAEAAEAITALRAENERLSKDYQTARDAHDRMLAENFSLSAWQCVYIDGKTGLVGDEHGNQYCAMSKRVDALRAEVKKLEGLLEQAVSRGCNHCIEQITPARSYFGEQQ